ncbi:hypothetical protein DFH06DRAFT_1296981 [Mycena polygramma]|nr:hypothetical protein DFH06DRAFT_1296981 [Mycena polygramma]
MTNTGEHAPCSGPIFAFQKSATRRTTAVTRCRGRKSARRNCWTVSAAYCTVVSVFDSELDAKRVAGTLWTPPLWPTSLLFDLQRHRRARKGGGGGGRACRLQVQRGVV